MKFPWFRPEDLKVKKLLDNVVAQELEALEKLDEGAKQRKNDELRELIKYYFELNHRIDERCTRISNFSLQFIILCGIGIGVLFRYQSVIDILVFTIILAFLAVQILYLLLIVLSYESAVRLKDIRYALAEGMPEQLERSSHVVNDLMRSFSRAFFRFWRRKGEPTAYVEGLRSFVRNYHEEDINKKILNNMEQLYALQAENAYCNRLCLRLRRLRFWSIMISVASGLLLALSFFLATTL